MIPSTKIAQMVPLNGSAQMNKRIARALDKKYILTTSPPEPLVHIQNNFTEFFLMMPSTKLQTWGELIVNANALIMHYFFPVIQGND